MDIITKTSRYLWLLAAPGFLLFGTVRSRPNIIVMQPDDLVFMDGWIPPPNNPDDPVRTDPYPTAGLPNLDTLRSNGLHMTQAYTTSPMCGTSRFSTLTGKMPSRSLSVRDNDDFRWVVIPTTKLTGRDCTNDNQPATFKNAGYRTGMFGKWHLLEVADDFSYSGATAQIQRCGFDTVKALYVENMPNDLSYSHNMEWMTYEAIRFINETTAADENFFMYFNPTVPHGSRDVEEAIEDFECTDVADPNYVWASDPWIKGMSEDGGCRAYRDTIVSRADTFEDLGKIWIDDAVGALLHALRDRGVLDNTIFLFQLDHGMDTKSALYEGGVRIPQFVHYPAELAPGTTYDGLVSVVDIAATMMDFAGITPPYQMDGKSWRSSVDDPVERAYWEDERCLFFEIQYDRAVRCGCYKYLDIESSTDSNTYRRGNRYGLSNNVGGNLFNLCNSFGKYELSPRVNKEESTVVNSVQQKKLIDALDCHMTATDANRSPDYTVCGSVPPTRPPTGAPTRTPTKRPKRGNNQKKTKKKSTKKKKKANAGRARDRRLVRILGELEPPAL